MKILGLVGKQIGACEAYRIVYPLNALKMKGGHDVSMITLDQAKEYTEKKIRWWLGFDIIVVQRVMGDKFEFPHLARSLGISTICDFDDDYTNKHRKVHSEPFGGFETFSAITVSTRHLAGVMREYNEHVYVIPNVITPESLKPFKRFIPDLSIGLTGSKSHQEDWLVAVEPLKQILRDFPHVKVFVSGHFPEGLEGVSGVVGLWDYFEDAKNSKNMYIPFEAYGLITQNIDIGLAPVDPSDGFNLSKSALKPLEYMASQRDIGQGQIGGAVPIVSDIPFYRDVVKDGVNGLIVDHKSEAQWYNAMKRLIEDEPFRRKLQLAGYRFVMKNYNIHNEWRRWEIVYSEVIKRDREALARGAGGPHKPMR